MASFEFEIDKNAAILKLQKSLTILAKSEGVVIPLEVLKKIVIEEMNPFPNFITSVRVLEMKTGNELSCAILPLSSDKLDDAFLVIRHTMTSA